ncbi:MAG TPA: biotin/lipoyl-containing protein [Anaerolineales bacterium]|nr:biotin/lipoyl-containing protein [Anaerolineales bacterium]
MKYVVNVAEKQYEVEIEDLNARPVIARIDGQEFKVSPQEANKALVQKEVRNSKPLEISRQPSASGLNTQELTAPLPGTVIEVFVKAGDTIETGQIILVIEAMKMKNSIRSTRAGKIADVLTGAGQTVAHKQILVRFTD